MTATPARRARRAAERGETPTPLPPRVPGERYQGTRGATASPEPTRTAHLAEGVNNPVIRSLSDVVALPVGSSVTVGTSGAASVHYKVGRDAWTASAGAFLTDEEVAARGIRRVSLGSIFHRSSTDEGRVSA